jgi:hypothetical protein
MDELEKEKKEGLSWDYLADVLPKKEKIGNKYQIPGWGLGATLFFLRLKLSLMNSARRRVKPCLEKPSRSSAGQEVGALPG